MRKIILKSFLAVILLSLVSCGGASESVDFGYMTHDPNLIENEALCNPYNRILPASDTDLIYEYIPSIIECGESMHSYHDFPCEPVVSIPPWQVGYIENIYTQPQYSYDVIIPFGRYGWIRISNDFIIAEKIVHDGSPPNEYGEVDSDSISFYSALLNFCGEYIVPLGTFNRILQVGDNFVVARDNQGNSGMYDFGGNPIVPTENYQPTVSTHNNIAITRNHEGLGAVDLDGNIIIPFGVYDNIWFTDNNRLFLTEERTDGRTQRRGIRDLEGNVIITPGQFEAIGGAHSAYGMVVVGRPSSTGFTGEALFNIKTGEIVSFSIQGLAAWDGLRIIKQGYAMTGRGIFNFYGELVSPENLFFHSHPRCNERWLFTVSQDNRTGIYDLRENEVFWLGSGLRVMELSYPLVLVSKDGILNNAVLDFYGQEVISFGTYHRIERILGENRFLIQSDLEDWQSRAVVNGAGQEIIPPGKYGYLSPISGTNFLWIEYCSYFGEGTGVIDFNGRIIFPQNEYLFREHWNLQNNHFFMIQDSNNSMALVRLTHNE